MSCLCVVSVFSGPLSRVVSLLSRDTFQDVLWMFEASVDTKLYIHACDKNLAYKLGIVGDKQQ